MKAMPRTRVSLKRNSKKAQITPTGCITLARSHPKNYFFLVPKIKFHQIARSCSYGRSFSNVSGDFVELASSLVIQDQLSMIYSRSSI